MLRIAISGITGWTGRALADAVMAASDLDLVAGVARSAAGETLPNGAPMFGDVASTLDAIDVDVLVDYTSPTVASDHVLEAIHRGVDVVLGTSGVTDEAMSRIDAAARTKGVGVITAGNFSPLAALLASTSAQVARHAPYREIIEFGSAAKPDAPSTTSKDVARKLADIDRRSLEVPLECTIGEVSARGTTVHGTQVHSVRLPSYTATVEVVLATDHERLTLKYEPGSGSAPYVDGTLIAVRAVRGRVGLLRGIGELIGP